MNTSRHIHRRSAFTLIELLVVITIIGVLAGMAFPVVTSVMNKARRVRTLAVIKDLHVAIKGYQTEYNRYPAPASETKDVEWKTTADHPLLKILLAAKSQQNTGGLNTRGIKFTDLPTAKGGKGGLVGTNEEDYRLVDEWGLEYTVIMDIDGDEKVKNPDVENDDPKIKAGASQLLPIGVAIYSLGPDSAKKPTPSKDDITSWRG